MWGGGWRRYFFPAFWLVYLGQAVDGVSKHAHGAGAVIGYVLVAAFAVFYLAALPMGWDSRMTRAFWSLYAVAIALTVAEAFLAGEDALVFCVYLAVLTVAGRRASGIPLVVALVVATAVVPRFVPSWGSKIDWNGALTVFLVAFAMFGFFMIIRSNVELTAARAEVARLAAENERTRIARDLHDLLGHSLTTITVKAGLARRLADARSRARGGRDRRGRAAVAPHAGRGPRRRGRATATSPWPASSPRHARCCGRPASRPTGPGAVDAVDVDAVELFGWVVREAVTNVVRHSRAEHCTITLGKRWIEISDDGRGGIPAAARDTG